MTLMMMPVIAAATVLTMVWTMSIMMHTPMSMLPKNIRLLLHFMKMVITKQTSLHKKKGAGRDGVCVRERERGEGDEDDGEIESSMHMVVRNGCLCVVVTSLNQTKITCDRC